MADELISRQAAIEILQKSHEAHAQNCREEVLLDRDIRLLKELPSVDAVEVVRCQYCAYFAEAKVNEKGFLICPASGMEITGMDYCSYGERKEDNAD